MSEVEKERYLANYPLGFGGPQPSSASWPANCAKVRRSTSACFRLRRARRRPLASGSSLSWRASRHV